MMFELVCVSRFLCTLWAHFKIESYIFGVEHAVHK